MVEVVSVNESDVIVKFLDSNRPSVYFHWPTIEDKCWVPVERITHINIKHILHNSDILINIGNF